MGPISKLPKPSRGSVFFSPSQALHKLSKRSINSKESKQYESTNGSAEAENNSNSNKKSTQSSYSTLSGGSRRRVSATERNEPSEEKAVDENNVSVSRSLNKTMSSVGETTYLSLPSPDSSLHEGEQRQGPVDVDTGEIVGQADILFGKGNKHLQNGEFEEALQAFHGIIRSQKNKDPSPLMASTYYNLGIAYSKLGSDTKSLEAFHNSVRMHKKCHGENHPGLALTFVRLGFLHLDKTKNYRKSLQAFHEALRIRESIYGTNHPLTAKIHNNLGVTNHHRKKFYKAKTHFQCALEIQRTIIIQLSQDPDKNARNIDRTNLDIANTLDNIASLIMDDVESANPNDQRIAIDSVEEAYQIRVKKYGENHSSVRSTAEKLELLKSMDWTAARRPISVDGKNSHTSTPKEKYSVEGASAKPTGQSHSSTIASSIKQESKNSTIHTDAKGKDCDSYEKRDSRLSLDRSLSGDIEKSKGLSVRPLEDGISTTNADDENTIVLLNDVGEDCKAIFEQASTFLKGGEYEKALEMYKAFLNSLEQHSIIRHPLIGMALHDIGIIHLREERFAEALLSFEKAISAKREALGKDHPDVAVSIVKVGIVQLLTQKHELALESFNEALFIRSKSLGDLHPSTARIYNNIGCIHVHASRMNDARLAYESALDIQRNAMVEKREKGLVLETAMTLVNLGILYRHQKSWKEAEVVLWEAYRLQRSILGPNHMTVLSTLDAIADIMAWNGDIDNALKYYKTVLRLLRNHHRTSPRTRPACLLLYKMHRIHVSRHDLEAAWKCLSEARVLSKQCQEPDQRNSDLEKRIAGEMERMEERSKITTMSSRKLENGPNTSNSADNSEKEKKENITDKTNKPSADSKEQLPKDVEVANVNEISKVIIKEKNDIDNSSNLEKNTHKSENTNNQQAQDATQSQNINQVINLSVNSVKVNEDTDIKMKIVEKQSTPTPMEVRYNQISEISQETEAVIVLNTPKVEIIQSSNNTISNEKPEVGEEDCPEHKDSVENEDCLDKDDQSLFSHVFDEESTTSHDNETEQQPQIVANKYRSRMEALLANCATGEGNQNPTTEDNNSCASSESDPSFGSEDLENGDNAFGVRSPPKLDGSSDFKSKLESMLTKRPEENSSKPWARSVTSKKDDPVSSVNEAFHEGMCKDEVCDEDEYDVNNVVTGSVTVQGIVNPNSPEEKCSNLKEKSIIQTKYFGQGLKSKPQQQQAAGESQSNGPESNPIYKKYFKMLQVGMPIDAVRHVMIRDSVDPSILDSYDVVPVDSATISTNGSSSTPSSQSNSSKKKLEELFAGRAGATKPVSESEGEKGSKAATKSKLENLFANRAKDNNNNNDVSTKEEAKSKLNNLFANRAKDNDLVEISKKDETKSKLNNLFANRVKDNKNEVSSKEETKSKLNNLFANRSKESDKDEASNKEATKSKLNNLFANRMKSSDADTENDIGAKEATKSKLNNLFANRAKPSKSAEEESKNSKLESLFAQRSSKPIDKDALLKGIQSAKTKKENKTQPALKDDPAYAKYFKMLKVGMPMEMVKHAMTRDQLDPRIIDGDPNLPAKIPEDPKKDSKKTENVVLLKDDPRFAKYFKMLKIGIPIDSVKHSMIRDGVDPDIIDGDPNKPANIKGEKKSEPSKTKSRRTRLHWEQKVQKEFGSGSVWAMVNQDPGLVNIHIDESEIKQLFEAKPVSSRKINKNNLANNGDNGGSTSNQAVSHKVVRKKKATVKVIDSKRANNGGIVLARIKLNFEQLAKVIDEMQSSIITQQQYQGILEYLPTPSEIKLLKKYLNDAEGEKRVALIEELCECEKFMVSMMNVEDADKKIKALLFRLEFDNSVDDLIRDACTISQACHELSSSIRFRKLLGIVLNVGNRVNMADENNSATAFSIKSLLKLKQSKANDKKTTFLHYVVLVAKRNDEDLTRFKSDLPSVFKAEKIFWDSCLSEAKTIENQLKDVRKLATKGLQNLSDSFEFSAEEMDSLSSSVIGQFLLQAVSKVKTLQQKIDETNKSYEELLEYFHEEKMQSHVFFNIIVQFSKSFDAAKSEIEAEDKKKRVKPSSSVKPSGSNNSNITHKGSEDDADTVKTEMELKQSASQNYNSVLHELKKKANMKKPNINMKSDIREV